MYIGCLVKLLNVINKHSGMHLVNIKKKIEKSFYA